MSKRQEIINGLLLLAYMLEDESVPLPSNVTADVYWQHTEQDKLGPGITQDDARNVMHAAPGGWSKEFTDAYVNYTRTLSEFVTYQVSFGREQVCSRVQVGEKTVPATAERIVPVYEWKCDGDED